MFQAALVLLESLRPRGGLLHLVLERRAVLGLGERAVAPQEIVRLRAGVRGRCCRDVRRLAEHLGGLAACGLRAAVHGKEHRAAPLGSPEALQLALQRRHAVPHARKLHCVALALLPQLPRRLLGYLRATARSAPAAGPEQMQWTMAMRMMMTTTTMLLLLLLTMQRHQGGRDLHAQARVLRRLPLLVHLEVQRGDLRAQQPCDELRLLGARLVLRRDRAPLHRKRLARHVEVPLQAPEPLGGVALSHGRPRRAGAHFHP